MAAKRPRQGVQRTKVSFVIVVFSTCAIVPLFVIFRARLCPDSNKGQTVMAALDRVESFLVSRKGEAYCEQCIQNELGIPRRRYVRDALPGFKWSSQHLERGGCDDCSEAAFGSVWAKRVALAWSALCCAA